jgi:hypothetical protein
MVVMENHDDIIQALSKNTELILKQIPVYDILLSISVDRHGPRIHASVRQEYVSLVPDGIEIVKDDQIIKIPIEVSSDYQTSKITFL